jgi:hypothetical protein
VRYPRISVADGGGQRVDHAALDAVGQVARVRDVLKAAPAVGNFLVLRQRIGDEREDTQIFALNVFGQRFSRPAPRVRIGVLQAVQRRLDASDPRRRYEAQAVIVSSKSRFHAPRPLTDFSWNSCSTRSSSW